jgi:hypothetical protein
MRQAEYVAQAIDASKPVRISTAIRCRIRSMKGVKVIIGNPLALNLFHNATEVEITRRDSGRVSLDEGYGNRRESVSRVHNREKSYRSAIRGPELPPEAEVAAEMVGRYQPIGPERKSGSSGSKPRPNCSS